MLQPIRTRTRITGVVQGVGFRPFVHALAARLGVSGFVGNDVHGVFVEAEAHRDVLDRFHAALREQAPPLAEIDELTSSELPATGATGFTIAGSDATGRAGALVAADSATCADCLAEVADADARRSGYAFTNCTNCGPRFTIVTGIPYDRPSTTMAPFPMCPACAAEYHDPADRRFHAQPVCCPDCGPRLRLTDASGAGLGPEPIAGAAELLRAGSVLAVKGLGGYHLAVDATRESACALLRARKHREDKAFAVMAGDLTAAHALCEIDAAGAELLISRRRPIVLLPHRADSPVAASVAPGNRELGLMLPYTPLHRLLLDATGAPIVLTSGNLSDEPIAYRDADAFDRLAPIADAFLTHDRDIRTRTDDSVVRPQPPGRRGAILLRRSRGYVPEPLRVPWEFPEPVLACGGELKNTFCLAEGNRAFLSHHIGDLENLETLRSFTDGIEHFQRLFEIEPQLVAHDLHPEYLSTKHARGLPGAQLVGVQHHHAHIASCLADNGSRGPVIGVAFDGTGYGTDGSMWGGEFLIADLAGFDRVGHLEQFRLPGGAAAIRHPWRTAAAVLHVAFDGDPPQDLAVLRRNADTWPTVQTLLRSGLNSPVTSSAGRLFDAVAAITGVRDAVSCEGQAAVELEQAADPAHRGTYRVPINGSDVLRPATADLVRGVVADVRSGVALPVISARFHNGIADAITDTCLQLSERTGIGEIALSGGVFANQVLLHRTVQRLAESGLQVLTHSRVPCNDGGLSLGQAVVAGARG
ncbi:carbamoyltransferase HypF [Saccharopolyspora sp. HNM0983]|uniref:Carbamoyltransferase n=1 Tax=Saccharopolyspora montiporae TaxID=2781240 RepID=A0A929BDF6_9PSEU|nr:carbamoyltransferase HypF [Saccharopolyspora sp. HNM0983]MBE9376018.1 carbamoyltransferase HypF [Saccharopolyspora sp. HNM0983]